MWNVQLNNYQPNEKINRSIEHFINGSAAAAACTLKCRHTSTRIQSNTCASVSVRMYLDNIGVEHPPDASIAAIAKSNRTGAVNRIESDHSFMTLVSSTGRVFWCWLVHCGTRLVSFRVNPDISTTMGSVCRYATPIVISIALFVGLATSTCVNRSTCSDQGDCVNTECSCKFFHGVLLLVNWIYLCADHTYILII